MSKPSPILFLDDHRGIYIPRDFAQCVVRECVSGISDEDYTDLLNPESDTYWDTWQLVVDAAIVTDGIRYRLYQDGDLWLIPEGMEWDDREGFWVWPTEQEAEQEG